MAITIAVSSERPPTIARAGSVDSLMSTPLVLQRTTQINSIQTARRSWRASRTASLELTSTVPFYKALVPPRQKHHQKLRDQDLGNGCHREGHGVAVIGQVV